MNEGIAPTRSGVRLKDSRMAVPSAAEPPARPVA